jgi:hypothetical protein
MNLKKIFVFGLFLGLTSGITLNVFAIPVVASDINVSNSYVQVAFTPEVGVVDPPGFSCFGDTLSPAIGSFLELGITAVSLPDPSVSIDTCFQQSGDYTVTIHLEDNAGNINDEGPYEFRVKASDVDPTLSLVVKTDCPDGIKANNVDECDLTLELRDEFENPVTQITQLTDIQLTTANFATDANTGVDFIDGLRLGDGISSPKMAFTLNSVTGDFDFSLQALAPTLEKVETYFSKLVDRALDFNVSIFDIGADGALGEVLNRTITTEGLTFMNLFELTPSGAGFAWSGEIADEGTITLDLTENDLVNGPNARSGGLNEYNDNLVYTNTDLDIALGGISLTGLNTTDVITHIALEPEMEYEEDQILRLTTGIQYDVSGSTISYPAGGTGFDTELGGEIANVIGYNTEITVAIVGADIEGGVIGNLDQMEIQPGTGTFNVSELTAKLRDQITENVYRLSRGSSNVREVGGNFDSNWFSTYDVVIVEVEGDNVVFTGGDVPEGRKTLIIRNGNFIVDGDMTYANPEDSFGVILMNDAQDDHTDGNIFVRPTIKTMVGSYYADGGLMTNNDPDPTVGNSSNAEGENIVQLLLTGTLFSQNTLGGSISLDEGAGTETYYLPWGTTTDHDLARKYDLHFVRQYQEVLTMNGNPVDNWTNCVPKVLPLTSADDCDDNKNSTVIRIDRKASVAPPPGFETTGSIVR